MKTPIPIPEIKIERGIPIPKGNYSNGSKYESIRKTLRAMDIGDSFVWPENKKICWLAKCENLRIKVRKLNGEGWRVWLIAKEYTRQPCGRKTT